MSTSSKKDGVARRDRYSADQLKAIQETLKGALGDESSQALENLQSRFTAAEDVAEEESPYQEEEEEYVSRGRGNRMDVGEVIKTRDIPKMVEAIPAFKDDEKATIQLVASILKHKEVKSFNLVDALSKVGQEVKLVNALVQGIISRKGVNPLIDALKYAICSPQAMKALAQAIADQGTVNHVLRAVASAPRDQAEAEIAWAMEVIGKGSMDQMLEAIKLMEDESPGTVILVTGLVNRQEVVVEPLVRAMGSCKRNSKALAILAVRLVKLVDAPSLVSLLEKYVTDDSEAGEIVSSYLVYQTALQPARRSLLPTASKKIRKECVAGRILAMGIVRHDDVDLMIKGFNTSNACPSAKRILAAEVVRKKGKFMALRTLGGSVWDMVKNTGEIRSDLKAAEDRYKTLLHQYLGVDPKKSFPLPASGEKKK